jgi:glutamate-5-semialdehyde dehydrogenase
VARLESETKVAALIGIAENIRTRRDELKAANQKDLEAGRAKGLGDALLDRLELNDLEQRRIINPDINEFDY